MEILKKLLRLIVICYHRTINWFSLTEEDLNFYITIGKNRFILNHQEKIQNHDLKDYFNKVKDFVNLEHTVQNLIGAYKFSNKLRGSLLIYFDQHGKFHCLMHNYEKGFEVISDYEKIIHLNTKKALKDKFTNRVYLLERI